MNLLSIGGSDPSGGAGIQSDIKTFEELKAHGLTVITAITAQNTTYFGGIQLSSQKIVKEQIRAVFSDFEINGIKISMVYNTDVIETLFQVLKNKTIPVVIDPVIKSTTGGILLERSALLKFKKLLIPLATVITPNIFEAEILTKTKINTKIDVVKAAEKIQSLGVKNVVITGIKDQKKILDFILEESTQYWHSTSEIPNINHGSGCNHSAAITFALANKKSIKESTLFAKKYTYQSIKNAENVGKGIRITQNRNQDNIMKELSQAISEFINIKDIFRKIPECQTNFVFSKKNPKSIKDILGIEGRIVKTGTRIRVAGNLEYGGSKHVATALMTMNKKFPVIRSAINLKYQEEILAAGKNRKLRISKYNRREEPKTIKKKEGSSIEWGINQAIKNMVIPPDIVYHKGDFGKEPMTIIFGNTPTDVLEKIQKINN